MNPIDRLEQLRADLARVTAERDHHKGVKATTDAAHRELSREHAALRARTAELEKDRDDWKKCADLAERALASEQQRSAELEAQIERDAWAISPAMAQARINMLASELGQVKQRNAELVAALRPIYALRKNCEGDIGWRGQKDAKVGWVTVRDILALEQALARAESATPAKHLDTEIVDWLDAQFQGGDDWCRLFPLGNTIREAYAARKQEASK